MIDDKGRQAIIQKHVAAMLEELNARGFDAIGIAGGVIFGSETAGERSVCSAFTLFDRDATCNGEPASAASVMKDVAEQMVRPHYS